MNQSALGSSGTPRNMLREGRREVQATSLTVAAWAKKQAGAAAFEELRSVCVIPASEKHNLYHGKPSLGHVFLQVEALEAVWFFKEWIRKQEDLFPSKWRNTDVAPGMKWVEGDSPQTEYSSPTLNNPVPSILVYCPHSLVNRLLS